MRVGSILNKIKKSALFRGFMSTAVGSGMARVFLVLTTWSVARLLSADDFGQFAFVRNTLELILSVCAVNFSSLCTRYTSELTNRPDSLHKLMLVLLFSFVLCFILGVLLVILPERWFLDVFGTNAIVQLLRFLGVLLPIIFVGPLINAIYRGLCMFKFAGIVQTISAIFFLICAIVLTWLYGLTGALWSILAYYACYATVQIIWLLKRTRLSLIVKKASGIMQHKRLLYQVILPMFLMSFIEAPAFWVAQLMLTKIEGFTAVGAMAVIMQLRNLVLIIPGYFFGTFMTFAAKMNSEHNYTTYYAKFDYLSKIMTIIGFFGVVCFALGSKWILGIFGSQYVEYHLPLIIGVLPLPILLITNLLKIHFTIQDYQRKLLVFSTAWNIVWILLFAVSSKISTVSPLLSFFITQDLALLSFLIAMMLTYYRDKKRFLYGKK